jgi:hypothetical protein
MMVPSSGFMPCFCIIYGFISEKVQLRVFFIHNFILISDGAVLGQEEQKESPCKLIGELVAFSCLRR